MPKPENRVTSQDMPRLLDILHGCEPHEQAEALTVLCPCRNRRYDREIWRAVFELYNRNEVLPLQVRDNAQHAIETLFDRARKDPRTQYLLLWLEGQGLCSRPLDGLLPKWRPGGRAGLNGLYIPRYEPPRRSKANRRKR